LTLFVSFLMLSILFRTVSGNLSPGVIHEASAMAASIAQLIAFAFLFLAMERMSPQQQYELCLKKTRGDIHKQESFQIEKIFEGGKFFDIIEHMQVRAGDELCIMWSFLRHEEVTDRFFHAIQDRGLKVKVLLVAPFSDGMLQRIQDISQRYVRDSGVISNLKTKSLANLEFLRRYREYKNKLGEGFNCEVRFTPFYCSRPMIIRKTRSGVVGDQSGTEHVEVAMGYFLSNESSKYPFILFGSNAVSDRSVARNSEDFFNARWNHGLHGVTFYRFVRIALERLRDDFRLKEDKTPPTTAQTARTVAE